MAFQTKSVPWSPASKISGHSFSSIDLEFFNMKISSIFCKRNVRRVQENDNVRLNAEISSLTLVCTFTKLVIDFGQGLTETK